MRRVHSHLCAVALTLACGSAAPEWSAEEIGNAEYVYSALHSDARAAEIENLGDAGFDDAQEEEASLEHRQQALQDARRVRDEILERLHPALRPHFRDEFQRSQALFLQARRDGDAALETEAIRLRNAWGDWWVRHDHEVAIPTLP